MIKKALITLFATFAISATVSAAPIEFHEFDNVDQEQQFKELSNTLRCPKCQNNTIGDSNAELAVDLRQKVYEMTKDGKSKQDIIDYMIARYGNFVTYNPPLTLATSTLGWSICCGCVWIWFDHLTQQKVKIESGSRVR